MRHLAKIAAAAIVAAACAGCVYKGAKITEGTDLAIGLNIPVTEGTLQFQALNYLSGFRLGVDRNAVLTVKYRVSETNSYLGCVNTCVVKEVEAKVEPCEIGGETEADNAPTNAVPVQMYLPTPNVMLTDAEA